jgi:hypothetical protein
MRRSRTHLDVLAVPVEEQDVAAPAVPRAGDALAVVEGVAFVSGAFPARDMLASWCHSYLVPSIPPRGLNSQESGRFSAVPWL